MSKQDSFDRFVSQDANAIVNAAFTGKRSRRNSEVVNAFLAQIQPNVIPSDPALPELRIVDGGHVQLDDTTPPVIPDFPKPTDPDVRPAIVRAWRHDGGMQSFPFYSEQAARELADDLSGVIYWKAVVVDPSGRNILYKRTIEATNVGEWWDHD